MINIGTKEVTTINDERINKDVTTINDNKKVVSFE